MQTACMAAACQPIVHGTRDNDDASIIMIITQSLVGRTSSGRIQCLAPQVHLYTLERGVQANNYGEISSDKNRVEVNH